MKENIYSKSIRVLTALAVVGAGCTRKISSVPVQPEGTKTSTHLPTVTTVPTQEATLTMVSPTATQEATATALLKNDLINPVLHHADSQPPENGVGSFDVGVKDDQIGLAFGVHIAWPKGGLDAGGGGCNLVILTPGWYENLQVQDGRYEVYDIPSNDYSGWVKVLGQQRADEQAKDYACPAKAFSDLPQWQSPIPSPR